MNVSRVAQSQIKHQVEQVRQQDRRDETHAKTVEKRGFDHIIAERVSRNLRAGSTKGQNIDIEC